MASRTPQKVGPFHLVRMLGMGGMAQVYHARKEIEGVGLVVALKIPRQHIVMDPAARQRFITEAMITARLGSHSNIVQVLDVGVDGDLPYMAMEYITGADLGQLCEAMIEARTRWSEPAILWVIASILQGLRHAWGAEVEGEPLRIVHRDISPSNILLTHEGYVKVTDFGISQMGVLEQSASIRGKARYMPSEQLQGRASAASDLYAVGAIAWELIEGKRFRHDKVTQDEMFLAALSGERPPITRTDISDRLKELVNSLLEPQESDRIQNPADAWAELKTCPGLNLVDPDPLRVLMEELLGQRRRSGYTQMDVRIHPELAATWAALAAAADAREDEPPSSAPTPAPAAAPAPVVAAPALRQGSASLGVAPTIPAGALAPGSGPLLARERPPTDPTMHLDGHEGTGPGPHGAAFGASGSTVLESPPALRGRAPGSSPHPGAAAEYTPVPGTPGYVPQGHSYTPTPGYREATPTPYDTPSPYAGDPRPPKRKTWVLFAALGIGSVLVGGLFTSLYLNRDKDGDTQAQVSANAAAVAPAGQKKDNVTPKAATPEEPAEPDEPIFDEPEADPPEEPASDDAPQDDSANANEPPPEDTAAPEPAAPPEEAEDDPEPEPVAAPPASKTPKRPKSAPPATVHVRLSLVDAIDLRVGSKVRHITGNKKIKLRSGTSRMAVRTPGSPTWYSSSVKMQAGKEYLLRLSAKRIELIPLSGGAQ